MLRSEWNEVVARVRLAEDPFVCDPWLDRLSFVNASQETLVLATPNRLYRQWIQDNLEPLLLDHIAAVTSQRYEISYKLDSERGGAISSAAGSGPVDEPAPAPSPSRFQLQINPRQTFASFVVGNGNQFAQAACENVAESPARNYNPLFIFGGVGLGKTHLLNGISNRMLEVNPGARILYLSAEEFTNELINSLRFKRMDEFREKFRQQCDALLVDDIQTLTGKERTQEEFFHTFNALHGSGRQIVVTADRYPKDILGLEERLRSRFDWGLVADIQPPDTETNMSILRKKADTEGIELPQDVAFFIARNASSNIRELEGTLTRLLAMSSFHASPIDLDFARRCLERFLQVQQPIVSVEHILSGTARFFNVKVTDIKGKRRTKQMVGPRQIAMYLARKHTGMSLPEIGKRFGGRDHTTVIHAVRKVTREIREDPGFRNKVQLVAQNLGLPTD